MNAINIRRSLVCFVVAFFFFLFITPAAFAQTIPATDLDGYAWSSNIGWISLNCRTGGATGNNICGTSNYKVTINADRTVSGYAWSSNIGWIRFGGLSSFPTGGGTSAVNANVVGTYPNLTFVGWARACSGTNAPVASESKDCSTMTINDNSGSWDGWISLQGTTYSIVTSSGGFNNDSFGWGHTVIGWVDMSDALLLNSTATLSVSSCVINTVGANTCTGSATWNITNGTSPNLYNTTTNTNYSSSASGNNVSVTIRLGSNTVQARDGSTVLATGNPTATCGAGLTASGGNCITAVDPAPVISIEATKRIARVGDTVSLDWTITPSPLVSGTCTIAGPGLSGSVTSSGSQLSSPLRSKSLFTITCVGSYGTVSDSVEIELIPTAQEA